MKVWVLSVALIFVASLSGCATVPWAEKRMVSVRSSLAAGKIDEAVNDIRTVLHYDDQDGATMRKELAKYPRASISLRKRLQREVDELKWVSTLKEIFKVADLSLRDGLLTAADFQVFMAHVSTQLKRANALSSLDIDYSNIAIWKDIAVLGEPEQQQIIFDRSVKAIPQTARGLDQRKRLLIGARDYAAAGGPASLADRKFRSTVLSARLTLEEIRDVVGPYDSAFAARLNEASAVTVFLVSEPSDRLFEEDVKQYVTKMNEDIQFVRSRGGAKQVVTIGKLQFEERPLQDNKKTITYRQYEVDVLGAALLMPKNASYMYEHVTGGLDVNAAFLLKIEANGAIKLDKVIRDSVSKRWSSCENPRIVNVFGGVQKAEFAANDNMRSKCGSSSSRPTVVDLRAESVERFSSQIVSAVTLE